ncbi:hypothetical protein ACFPM7_00210 [Actinokineospora guangxiensis]|uniref:Glycosyltransferase RgtA/B/C/D-like domain-containing protein n=1 Tax=Actinokineospora guangxiensis TaxID=1490288 RepID=A0ABW0EGP2_9PSEU
MSAPTADRTGRAQLAARAIPRLVEAVALVPLVVMVVDVLRAPKLPLLDYWDVLLRITTPSGGFEPDGLLTLQNEHPLMLPSVLYWINARIFDGDNRTLGLAVVLIAALTVLLLRAALPRSIPPIVRAGLVAAASLLVFSPHGLHNFAMAMSGAAWLMANLFSVAALLLAVRGRWWPAWAAALLACLSYGTGFPVWVGIAVIAVVRGEPVWRRVLPIGALAGVLATWTALRPAVEAGTAGTDDFGTLVFRFFTVVGHLWTAKDAGLAAAAGVAVVAALALLLTVADARRSDLLFWWVLACHGLMCCGMIALARLDYGANQGLTGRYTSLATLSCLPLLVIAAALLARREAAKAAVLAVGVGVLGFALGSPEAISVRSNIREAQVQAIAMRAGIAEDLDYRLPDSDRLNPRLAAMGHFPFSADFSLGCAGPELGSRVDLSTAAPLGAPPGPDAPPAVVGYLDSVEPRDGALLVRGWVSGAGLGARCAILVSADGTVTGGGLVSQPRSDVATEYRWAGQDTGFVVVGRGGPGARLVVVLLDGRVLTTELPAADPEGGT